MHIDAGFIQRMAAYNAWMTGKLYSAAEKMSDEERKEDRGAFFRSVHSTLNHILFADRSWIGRFTGKVYEVKGMGVDLCDDFQDLKAAHLFMCDEIVAFGATVTEEWLAKELTWTNSSGLTSTRPAWLLVTHMFNHQTHHRGQVSTLLTQAGVDIGVTDLPYMPDLI